MFLSSYENKIDKKGRVSVPATFRSHLSSMGYNGFISYPSFNHSALEACSQERIEKISIAPPESAKPIAVPTRGAVQGVAKKVKNIPVKKSAM